jgi:hypothetical protein
MNKENSYRAGKDSRKERVAGQYNLIPNFE